MKRSLLCLILVLFWTECQTDCTYSKHKVKDSVPHLASKRMAQLKGKKFALGEPDDQGYKYIIGVCTNVPVAGEDPNKTVGVVQIDTKHNNKNYIIGRITDAEVKAGTDWVMLEYGKGDPYTKSRHCGGEGRRALIMFICDPNETEGKVRVIEENNKKVKDCYYLFEIDHKLACSSAKHSITVYGLSIGSVLVIVFVTVAALYLIGGFLYQRFVVGSKGWEQLPNYGFWQDFGNLQADGCNFVCRTHKSSESRPYKGLGDDQLQEEDDGRDDHLLPM